MRRLLGGKIDRETTAAAGAALDLERATVGQDDRARDGQTEPAPARVAAPTGVEPHEGLEDARGVGGIDSDSGVLDEDRHALARSLQRDHHASARGRVLDRVVDEVQKRAPQGAGIALHHRGRCRTHADIDALALGQAHAQLERFEDRKSTRLNSSHSSSSYAVFCLKKKKFNIFYVMNNAKLEMNNKILSQNKMI